MDDKEKLILINESIQHAKVANFYRNRLPNRPIQSLDELIGLPLTSKADIRSHSPNGLIAIEKKKLAQYHESSGTTGNPISVWYSKKDLRDNTKRINESGVNFHEEDIVLIRFPYALSIIAHVLHGASQRQNACVIPADSRTTITPMPRIIDLLRKIDVTVLCCIPLQAIMLAEIAQQLNLDPKRDFPSLRAICTAGEPLTDYRRELLENIWGIPVYDNYGMTETGTIMVECKQRRLHVFEDSFHAEVLEDDYKTKVSSGVRGNLIITSLRKKATPMIRYLTGDLVSVDNEPCRCGKYPSYKIRGRKDQLIHVNENKLDLWDLEEIISVLPCRRFWKVGMHNKSLLFVVEKEMETEQIDPQYLTAFTEKYNFPIRFLLVEKGTLYDRSELLSFGMKGKPQYFLSNEEIKCFITKINSN